MVDGEIVVPAADGTTDFSVLQNELKGSSKTIVLVAFDLLYLNGHDIRKVPLAQTSVGEAATTGLAAAASSNGTLNGVQSPTP